MADEGQKLLSSFSGGRRRFRGGAVDQALTADLETAKKALEEASARCAGLPPDDAGCKELTEKVAAAEAAVAAAELADAEAAKAAANQEAAPVTPPSGGRRRSRRRSSSSSSSSSSRRRRSSRRSRRRR